MNAPTIGITVHITLNDARDPPTKVADAELHFVGGPLAGLKLIGFEVWQQRAGVIRYVTVPARLSLMSGEPRTCPLLRPIDDNQAAYIPIHSLILVACRVAEAAAPTTRPLTAEQLVRETLQPTHRLTDEQAIELIEDIAVVMGVERLNARGAWRLIVARLGGIHNLPAHLTVLTGRHRAKLADAARTPRQYAARLYVGPSFVRRIAEHMRQARIDVTIEGTEHVHYTIAAPSPDSVPQHTAAALRRMFPPSADGYSWEWVADCVSDVRPDDSARPEDHSPRITSPNGNRPH